MHHTDPLDASTRARITAALNPPEPGPARLDPLTVQIAGSHYKDFTIQPAEFCEVNHLSFLESCVIKRMCRHKTKNKIQDLEKAIHEIRLIAKIQYGEILP